MTKNPSILKWVEEKKAWLQPDQVMWIDGSEAQLEALRAEGCRTGELIKLNEEKLPGCYLHRSALNDVARVEGRTFICSEKEEDAGPTNNWMAPKEAYALLDEISKGAYKAGTPNIVGFAGDWTQALYGVVEGVKIDYSSDATLDDGNGGTINLFQQNMFAVRAEIEIGFRCDTSVFNAITE